LHVLSIPPAFVLSQDQTLKFDSVYFFVQKNQQVSAILR
jgi:hypothetical protein